MDRVPHQQNMPLSMEIESPTEKNKVQVGSEIESPTEKNKIQIGSEIKSPPQKKPKLNEDEDEDEDEDDYDDVYSSSSGTTYDNEMMGDDFVPIPPGVCGNCDSDYDDEYRTSYTSKVDDQVWVNYFQQIQESDGFDFTDYPGACFAATIFPMPFYLNCPENVDMLKDYCGRALKLYNAKYETNYEVKEILKVNGSGCSSFIFLTTFSVKTADGGEDIFQAKVVEDLDGNVEFPIIRPKGFVMSFFSVERNGMNGVEEVQTEDYTAETESISEKKQPIPIELHEEEEDFLSAFQMMTFSDDDVYDDSSPIRPSSPMYDEVSTDEEYRPDDEPMDKEVWARYKQQIKESQGFDIIDYPGTCFAATILPMAYFLTDAKYNNKMKDYSGRALKIYNAHYGTNYEVKDVLNLNGSGGGYFTFYITFSVITVDGSEDIFQAKVVEDLAYNLKFPIIRPKGRKDLEMKYPIEPRVCCGGH